jgi:hypothetical protein
MQRPAILIITERFVRSLCFSVAKVLDGEASHVETAKRITLASCSENDYLAQAFRREFTTAVTSLITSFIAHLRTRSHELSQSFSELVIYGKIY